ncbi:MAG: GspH/FimT family protein [Burkholderiales bacterium]
MALTRFACVATGESRAIALRRGPVVFVRAFTLVELLIALAVASLLAALVAPPWRSQLAAAELRERAEALALAMARARSEAIKRGTRVDLCPTADRSTCAISGEWEAGWIAFPNDTGTQPQGPLQLVVAADPGARAGITIRGNGPVARYVSYTSLGHARRHDGALQMGTFTVCRRGADAFKVVLANSGRTRIDATNEACP